MKLNLTLLNNAACVCLLAFSARADDSMTSTMDDSSSSNQMREVRGMMRSYQLNGAVKASDVIGLKVYNYQDEELGKVKDLLLDVEAGRAVQVIVANGGFMSVGGTLTAVPPGLFHCENSNSVIHLDVTKERFAAAPKFVVTDNDDLEQQSNSVREAYDYYGQRPFFINARYGTNIIEETLGGPLPLNMDGTPNVSGGRLMDMAYRQKIADANGQPVDTTNTSYSTMESTNSAGYWNSRHMHRAQLGYLQRASKLMGLPVRNLQDEKVGSIKDFSVDIAAGRIVAIIVSSGGFLGMGNELSTIPPTALHFDDRHGVLILDTTKEAMANAPHFNANQWPDVGQPAYAGRMYRAYKVDPYFNTNDMGTNGMVDADNAGRNVRDRHGRTLTPLDQGNSREDINTTSQIRKEIIANHAMSTNARNVKIITLNGKVTLRGPVNTTEEMNTIGEIANRIASPDNVDNQLEVRVKNSN